MSFMALIDRSRERRMKIVTNRATSHEEAEMWDLEFWQMMSPEDRDIDLVELSRTRTEPGDD
jgi:hypothetical protein